VKMARYPFITHVNKYLSVVGDTYSEATYVEKERRYRRMARVFNILYSKGKVSTNNPKKITADDVLAYVGYLKKEKLKPKSISHNLSALDNLLIYNSNYSVKLFKTKYPFQVPKSANARLPVMQNSTYDLIIKNAKAVPEDDWRRIRAYAIVVIALSTGMRTKEIQFSEVSNLDTNQWTLYIDRVKGERTYGQARNIPIRPEGRSIIQRYLVSRNKMLIEHGKENNPFLFPALRGENEGYLSGNSLRMDKRIVENEVESSFDYRMCRRTYAQKLLDESGNYPNLSLILGHNNTKTTEDSYARKLPQRAVKETLELWNDEVDTSMKYQPDSKSDPIKDKWGISGYG